MRLFSVAGPGPYDLPKKAPRNKSIKSPCKKFPPHFIRYSSIETFKHEYNCINCIYIEHASMSVLVAPPQSVFSATNPTKAQVHGRGPTNPCLPSHGGGKNQYIYGRGKQKYWGDIIIFKIQQSISELSEYQISELSELDKYKIKIKASNCQV